MRVSITLAMLVLGISSHASAVEVKSRIESVSMFKNGLAVVKRTVEVTGPGEYVLTEVPEPVHGTFWVESNAVVQTRVTTREVDVPLDRSAGADMQGDLAGRQVTIHFREAAAPAIEGKVIELAEPDRNWGRDYQPPSYNYWYWPNSRGEASPPVGRFLILQTDKSRLYIDPSTIGWVEVHDAANTLKRRMNVLVLTVKTGADTAKPPWVSISYLAKGISWAPSYRVDLSDDKTLNLRQHAVIKNELTDIEDAEFFLISGYPSIEFAHVVSPLSPRTTLAGFFTQLSQQYRLAHSSRGDIVTQQAVMYNAAPSSDSGDTLGAIPDGEGVDLHFQSIGRLTMNEGDSLMIDVASGQAPYERIVEWIVPDTRDAYGRPIDQYRRDQEPDKYKDAPWDAVRFKNPLKFPMTTGPAMIVDRGRFNGQRTSFWTNVGEQNTIQINKALSVRTRQFEQEIPGDREKITIDTSRYFKVPVQGELSVNNHRAESITMVIRRQFSGHLNEASDSPRDVQLEEGVYSINPRHELTWTITLKPGEERDLTYKYTVLVRD